MKFIFILCCISILAIEIVSSFYGEEFNITLSLGWLCALIWCLIATKDEK